MTDKKKIMKDIGLNEPVSVTLPAHVWVGFIAAFSSSKFRSEDAATIQEEAVAQVFDPLFLSEREAARQQHRDMHKAVIDQVLTGKRPEIPPNMEEGLG